MPDREQTPTPDEQPSPGNAAAPDTDTGITPSTEPADTGAQSNNGRMNINRFAFYFLLSIIVVLAFNFIFIIEDFLPSIASGCILAYLMYPVYQWLLTRTRRASFSAFVVLSITFVIILVPLGFITSALQNQVQFIFTEQTINRLQESFTAAESFFQERFNISIPDNFINDLFPRLFSGVQSAVTTYGPRMLASITRIVLSTFITFFLMYYFLVNADSVINTYMYYFPLTRKNKEKLMHQLGGETRALILGQLLVAVMQGTLGGIGFFIFGIERAVFWALVMVVASFLPFLGAGLVWFPASVLLFLNGEYMASIGLLLWGGIIVSSSDNFVRPKLTSALGQLHPVTVLLGVFIGIKEWGLVGIVIGPLIISGLIILIKMFREEYISE